MPDTDHTSLLDASSMLTGENIIDRHWVTAPYVGILPRVLKDAVAKKLITQEQFDSHRQAAYAQTDGALFLCAVFNDGTDTLYGTSVPPKEWGYK
jgi:hypothetical protein